MNELKSIIERNSEKFGQFEYYYLLIDKAEKNLHENPDISIECSKALIEGICTTILVSLDETLNQENILKRYNLQKIFKEYKEKLADYNQDFELEFVNGFNHSVKLIGEIRTKRGDVAHGKKVPKEISSSKEFASFIMNLTSSLLVYSLEHFFKIEFLEEIVYEKNEEFNNEIDELHQLPGKTKYSLALFEQYPQDYKAQLLEFKANKEQDKSDESSEMEPSNESVEVEVLEEKEPNIMKEIEEITIAEISSKYTLLSSEEIFEENLQQLCNDDNLYVNETLKLIDNYLFEEKEPLRDDFIKLLKTKPKLLERNKFVDVIKEKIYKFIEENIKNEKETLH